MNKDFYSKYVSTHTAHIYGEIRLNSIKKNFVFWNNYFGKFLPKDKRAKILDAGCGMGDLVLWLKDIGFTNVKGVDISSEQILTGKKIGITDIYEGDIFEEFSNNSNAYDVIFARDILEHFTKDEAVSFCKHVANSLTDKGMFIVQTANAENLLWGRLRYGDFTHEQAFTENSIRQLLMVAGFKDIIVFPQRPVIHGIKSLFRYAVWMCFELVLKFYLVIETGSFKGIFTQNLLATARK